MNATFPIVGRVRELELAERAFDLALGGCAVGIVITGAPGIGKTRLAEELVARAAKRGARTVSGRAWDMGEAPAYWPWRRALMDLSADSARVLAADDTRFAVLEACAELVRAQGRSAPLLVWLEDVHAADAPTLVLARFLLRHVGNVPFVLLLTHRPAYPSALSPLLADLARESVTINLEGLTSDDVEALIASRSGTKPSRPSAETLTRITGGHPLFVVELAGSRASLAAIESARPVPLPASLEAAIEAHVSAVGDDARILATALATLTPEYGALAGALAGLDSEDEARAWEELRRTGIVEAGAPPRFAHPLFGEALAQSGEPTEVEARHARAAELLEDVSGPGAAAERARHLLAAGATTRASALTAALEAARSAQARGEHEDAVRWAEAVLAEASPLDEHDALRAEATLLLGLGTLAVGSRIEGTRTLDAAIRLGRQAGRPDLLARSAIALARAGTGLVQPAAGVTAALEEAAGQLDEEDPLGIEALSALAIGLRGDPRDPRGARAAIEAVQRAERRGEVRPLMRALDGALTARYGPDNVRDRIEIGARLVAAGRAHGDRAAELDGLRWRVGGLLELGDLARAAPEIAAYCAVAVESRLPGPRITSTSRAAELAFLAGKYEEGEKLAREAHAVGLRAADPSADFLLAAQLLVPLFDRDRPDELRLSITHAMDAMAALHGSAVPRTVIAAQRAFLGEHEAAREAVRHALSEIGPADAFVQHGLLAMLIWAGFLSGVGEELAVARRALEPYADRVACAGSAFALGSIARYVGLAAERLEGPAAARRWYEQAVAHNVALGAAPYEVRARLELARVLRALGADGDAEEARARRLAATIGLALASRSAPADRTNARGVFRREGSWFRVGLGDDTVLVPKSRGLAYIAALLAAPRTEAHVLDLVVQHEPGTTIANDDLGPLLDPRAKDAYRARVIDLRADLSDAEATHDLARADRARTELEALTQELARAVGLGGRDRRAGSNAERARMAVRVAIRRTLDVLERDHSALAAHLGRSLRTGMFCAYDPDPSVGIAWELGEVGAADS